MIQGFSFCGDNNPVRPENAGKAATVTRLAFNLRMLGSSLVSSSHVKDRINSGPTTSGSILSKCYWHANSDYPTPPFFQATSSRR